MRASRRPHRGVSLHRRRVAGRVGTQDEVLRGLPGLEEKTRTRLRDFMMAARTMIEGDAAASVATVERIIASEFSDPEGLFYLARHLRT